MVNNSYSSSENNLQFDNRSLDEILADSEQKSNTNASNNDNDPEELNLDERPFHTYYEDEER